MTEHYITPTLQALLDKSAKPKTPAFNPERWTNDHEERVVLNRKKRAEKKAAPVLLKPCARPACDNTAKNIYCSIKCCNRHRQEQGGQVKTMPEQWLNPLKGKPKKVKV